MKTDYAISERMNQIQQRLDRYHESRKNPNEGRWSREELANAEAAVMGHALADLEFLLVNLNHERQ